ncbi:hypothetical protein WICPIJ_000897 [Wickerhamomyces pijperi]|uniref:Uncharacterized protein n=1 Tax=Wickerhamomyces pijperi TaxID=599730 RepID=A0A9P8TR56_WICPI|nr:hypothetical protein WICPIJ_000897 [Wickerhamomyces pijperi]
MSQFIRSDINIISSSTLRPGSRSTSAQPLATSSNSPETETSTDSTEESDKETINVEQLDLKLKTLTSNKVYFSELAPSNSGTYPLAPNNTLSKIGVDDTSRSFTYRGVSAEDNTTTDSLVFHSANDFYNFNDSISIRGCPSYELETEPLNDERDPVGTRNASLQPLISANHTNYFSTLSSADFSRSPNVADHREEVQAETVLPWKVRLFKYGLSWVNKFRKREREPDLERQPLLPPSHQDPNYTDRPITREHPSGGCGDGSPAAEPTPLTRFLSENTWVYYVLAAILTLSGGLYVIFTGDYSTLAKIARALCCYILGSTLALRLFGDGFCPQYNKIEG